MALDFLCIGAPKAGTTWLQNRLQRHPQIWIPPIKELHYFDRRFPIPLVARRADRDKGLLGIHEAHLRKQIVSSYGRALRHLSLEELRWVNRYFRGRPTDSWYRSLFAGRDGLVCGEMTTDYCALSDEAIAHMHREYPGLHVVLMLREPVARAWSHARMLLPNQLDKPLAEIGTEEFLRFLRHPAAIRKGAYARIIGRWRRHFPAERFFIGFFEDVAAQPADLLTEVFRFLDVSPDVSGPFRDMHTRVNVGSGQPQMPPAVRRILAREYRDDLRELAKLVDSYAVGWLEEAERTLA